jgi:hypothetical protein
MTLQRAHGAAICLVSLLFAAPASADTYYVSTTGDDGDAGTSRTHPWRTPARVNRTDLAPGDRVLFEGGRTFGGGVQLDAADTGTAAAPVVIGSYGSGRAKLAATGQPGLFAEGMGGLVVRDLRIVGPGRDASDSNGLTVYAGGPWGHRFPRVRVERVEVAGFGRWGVQVGTWAGPAGFDGIDILQVDAHANALGGIGIYAQQRAANRAVTVRDSRAWDNPGRAGLASNSGNGIVVGGADGGLIEGSVAHDNGGRDTAHEGPVGIWTYDSRGVVIERNESYANRTGGPKDGGGFDLDDRVSDSVLQYNHSHDNDGAGFLIAHPSGDPLHTRNVVRFNLSERDGRRNGFAGVTIWGRTTQLDVFHNTVVGPAAAVRADELGDGFAALRNNAFVRTARGPLLDISATAAPARFHGNAYWSTVGPPTIDWSGARYAGLAAWRAATGQERVGDADTGIDRDPRFAGGTQSGGAAAYVPTAGSPLVDAALDLTPFGVSLGGRDLRGAAVPTGVRADIGALEAPGRVSRPPAVPPTSASGSAPASSAAPAGLGDPSVPLVPAHSGRLASPRLRIQRIVRRGRRVLVAGTVARNLPAGARVRARLRQGRAWGPAARSSTRHGHFSALVTPPRSGLRRGRVTVTYACDRAHVAQRRTRRVPPSSWPAVPGR